MAKSKQTPEETEDLVIAPVQQISEESKALAIKVISKNDLAHLKELEKEIATFKKEYGGLTIKDETDEEGYEKVRQALGVMRPRRTGLDKERKSVTEPYRLSINYINNEYQAVINQIAEIEQPLKSRKQEIDKLEDARKEQERLEREQKHNNRINELIQNGCVFDGEYYAIGSEELGVPEISLSVVDIRAMSDELYANFLQQVIRANGKIQAEKERLQIEADNKKKEEEEQRRKDQEEFDRKQAELKKQQEEFDEKQRKMNEQMEKLQQARDNARIKRLESIGLTYQPTFDFYTFFDVKVDVKTEVKSMEDEEWDALIDKITPAVEEIKIERQKEEERISILVTRRNDLKQLGFVLNELGTWVGKYSVLSNEVVTDLEADWEATMEEIRMLITDREEKERIARENEIKEKALEEQREQDRKDREEKEAQLAMANDKTKWNHLVQQFSAIQFPEMKSPAYQKKVSAIKEFIQSL